MALIKQLSSLVLKGRQVLNDCSHTRLWSMMQNMNMSCRMMCAGFLGLNMTWVTGVSLSNHRECSPCFCSFRLHSVYSFCTREYSKICTTYTENTHCNNICRVYFISVSSLRNFTLCFYCGRQSRLAVYYKITVGQNLTQCLPAGQHAPWQGCWLLGGWLWQWDRSCTLELYNEAANVQRQQEFTVVALAPVTTLPIKK